MSINHFSSAPLKGAEAKRSWGRVLPFAIVMVLLAVGGRKVVFGLPVGLSPTITENKSTKTLTINNVDASISKKLYTPIATSTFDSDADGWTAITLNLNGPYDALGSQYTPVHSSSGGNPSGHISLNDPDNKVAYWEAPAKYLGSQSIAYEGSLTFDIKDSQATNPYFDADVVLVGSGITLVFDIPSNPSTSWTSYSVDLTETAGWKKNSLNGSAATQTEMQSVLSSLTYLRIRAEYTSYIPEEIMSLDNVVLTSPISNLSLYALAFDNDPTSPSNLSPQFAETMDGIVEASAGNPDKRAVVLVDQDGESDTRIFMIHDGEVTPIVGLPDSDGVLSTSLNEYDMADGNTLGGFLKWARSSYGAAETKTTFSYVSHGTFLAPAVDLSAVFPQTTRLAGGSAMSGPLFPLPYMVRAHPDFTDAHSNALITPHALQVALDVGTNGGSDPIEVLDIVHCFGASLEQFHELSNPSGTPYAKTIIGSPNYTYFAPQMAGQALAALDASDDAATLATSIMTAYEAELQEADLSDEDADVDHPRSMVVVESSKIPAIKERMDEMAWYLMQELGNNPSATKDKLAAAYGATGTYYDTTYCSPQDWELAAPDALVDSSAFLWQLADQNISTGVTFRALQVANLVDEAVISHIARNGVPWFADPLTPNWTFDGPNASGLALYADLEGQTDGSNRDLSWQGRFYTDTTSIAAANDNPHPYLFVQGGFKGRTWADVLQRFWEVKSEDENLTVRTVGCLPELPPVVRDGELTAERTIFPVQSTLFAGYATKLGAAIQTADPATNPLVRFKVDVGGVTVFSNTISTGYLVAGTHYVQADEQWTPPTNGLFTLDVTVDPDDRFLEQDESDNQVTMIDAIFSDTPFQMSATTAGQRQWVDSRTVDLELTADEIDILVAQIHEYVPGADPNTQVPTMTHQLYLNSPSLPNFSLELPAEVEPGPITVHLWGIADGKLSQEVAIVEFNYAPATRALGTGTDYFLFEASAGDNMQISANVTAGEANMYIWEPGNLWTAQMVNVTSGNSDSIVFNPAQAGEYLVMVEGVAAGTQYTISSQRNGQPGRALAPSPNRSSASQLIVQKRKPTLLAPVPQTPEIWQPEPLPTLYLPIITRN